jgi:hypothetical protein
MFGCHQISPINNNVALFVAIQFGLLPGKNNLLGESRFFIGTSPIQGV